MREVAGQCLCGNVRYHFEADQLVAYQCHCSICKCSSGTAFSTTLLAKADGFRWGIGEESIKSYSLASGFTVQFCNNCGSPVPNKFRGHPFYSIPAGGLDKEENIEVAVQIFLGSKAKWDQEKFNGLKYEEMPTLQEMFAVLHQGTDK